MPRRLIAECTLAAAPAETHENIAWRTLIATGTVLEPDAPPLSLLSARRIRRHPHLPHQDQESPPIPRQCNTEYTLDVHHTYTIRTISEHHPYTMRTISVHDPYTMRTPSQFQMRWSVIRLMRR